MSLISFESIHTTHVDACPPFTVVHSEKVDLGAQGQLISPASPTERQC